MNFRQLIAKYVLGALSADKISEFACTGIEEGFNSPSLYILAGFNKNANSFEVERYFNLTMAELNIHIPSKRTAAIEYANGISEEIIDGKREIINGVRGIKSILDECGFYEENVYYVYDSIFFEKAYGLYDTYDDLLAADVEWDKHKSNKDLMEETKMELFEELKKLEQQNKNLPQRSTLSLPFVINSPINQLTNKKRIFAAITR